MTAPNELSVCVVDDDPAMRDSLQLLLRSAGFEAHTFPSASTFLAGFDPESTGCVLLDVRMKGMSGLELQRELAAQYPVVPVVLISGHADVPMAVQAMRSGAVDVVEKPFDHDALLDRVRQCLERSRELRVQRREADKIRTALDQLTPREREVAELLAQGKASKVIAGELAISAKTVDVHRSRIMAKLGLRTTTELVRVMLSLGR